MSLDATPNPPHKKAARASPDICAACRARKVRCDGRRSVCTNCERLSFTCSFENPQTDGVRISAAPVSRRRAHLACFSCHSRKVRCNQDQPGCRRCSRLGIVCVYPVPGRAHSSNSPIQETSSYNPVEATDPYEPSEQLAIKALTIFFTRIRHIPIFSFLHRALVMDQYRNKNINKALLLSIIGVVSVYHDLGPGMVERGNEFISRAETLVHRDLETPTVPHVQALIFIIKHRAYRRRFTSAFALMAIATRFAMGLRMNYDDSKLDFLTQECCRRTMWSLYLIDTVMSAGYRDFALSSSQLLHIQLPTHDSNFDFDIPEQGDYLESPHHSPEGKAPSILSLVIRVMHIRYNVL